MARVDALGWLRETNRTYRGNAAAVRDFRVQLRGSRSALLFGVYLFVLIGVGMLVYSNTAGTQMSVVDAQRELAQFYNVVMILLASTICLVAPALSATAVVMERQRRSLDLVFSAPVSPRYYLVGKAISSYRYTWMLLVLSLPVTATCVVLGGATWSDVLEAYGLLSLHALALTSIALLLSTVALKPVSAIVWSYGAALAYLTATAAGAAAAAIPSMIGRSGSNEVPFFVALNPFSVVQASGTYTTISGVQVPNWIFAAILTLLTSKICLLGAGSMLSAYGAAETKSLRLHGLLYAWALALYMGWMIGTATRGFTTSSSVLGISLCWALMPFTLVLLPFLSCFGYDGERKFWPNGAVSIRRTLDGTPAGALPYILALVGGCALMGALGFWWKSGQFPASEFWAYALYTIGFWTLFWAIGRLASSWFTGIRSARTIVVAAMVFVAVLPAPFLSAISRDSFDSSGFSVWELYPLRPLLSGGTERPGAAAVWGIVFLATATMLALQAERNVRKRTGSLGESSGKDLAAA